MGKHERKGPPRRPNFDRVAEIAKEHILFAKENPGKAEEVARSLGVNVEDVIAVAIADQVTEEFALVPLERPKGNGFNIVR